MVGSLKILRLLQREFQQAKRASGEGEIRMDLMAEGIQEWKRFIDTWCFYGGSPEDSNGTQYSHTAHEIRDSGVS